MLCHQRSRIRLVVGKKIGHFTYFDARQVHMDAEEPGALKVPSLDGFGRDQPAAAGPFMNKRPKIRGVRCREAERSRNPGPSRDLGCTSRPTQPARSENRLSRPEKRVFGLSSPSNWRTVVQASSLRTFSVGAMATGLSLPFVRVVGFLGFSWQATSYL
jgi:hypothetical protein